MVQRYTPFASGYGDGYMCESAGGDWVEYEDYAALESERDELVELLNFYGIDDLNKARECYREYNDN